MKTIYTAIIARLKEQVPALKWTDMNIGQLETIERPSVMFPCALVTIKIPKASDESHTGKTQNCVGQINITLGFDVPERTSGNAPEANRLQGLAAYDVIADVYAALQGFYTEKFNSLSRTNQGEGTIKNGVFRYPISFSVEFEDATAETLPVPIE